MAFPAVAPNASSLPYAIRPKGLDLAGLIAINVLGLAAAPFFVATTYRDMPPTSIHGLLPDLGLIALSILCALRLFRLKDPEVELFSDRLVRPGLFGPTVLYRSDISGVGKTYTTRAGSYFSIAAEPGRGQSLTLRGSLRQDPVFADWLSGAPDPVVVAREADRASVVSDYRYGGSEGDRRRRLDWAQRIVIGFSVVCVAIAIGLGFLEVPAPVALGVAAACAVVAYALVAKSDGLIVWRSRSGVRPTALAGFLPAAALCGRGMLTVHMLDFDALLIAATVAGVGIALLFYQSMDSSGRRLQSSLALGAFGGVLAYGAGAYLDSLSTGHPDRSYVVTVEDKRVSHGRSTTYYLQVPPWGDRPADEVSVSSGLYDQVQVGSNVCIDRYGGDLRLAWFRLGQCLKPGLKTRDDDLRSGATLMRQGQFAQAAAAFQQAAARDPDSENAWGELAMAHVWMGQAKAAEREAAKAAALDSGSPYVLAVQAFVAEGLGHPSQAKADFDKILKQSPKDAFGHEQRANVEIQLGAYQAAVADIDPVIAAFPHDNSARLIKARAYLGLNRMDEVRRVAADLDPASTDPNVLLTRAHILSMGDDRASALTALDRAVALRPSAILYLDRAQLQALSNPAAARADAQAALRLSPGWRPAVQILAGIDQRARDEAANRDAAPAPPSKSRRR